MCLFLVLEDPVTFARLPEPPERRWGAGRAWAAPSSCGASPGCPDPGKTWSPVNRAG